MEQNPFKFKIEVEGIQEFKDDLKEIEETLDRIIQKYEKVKEVN
ncbi:MAG: hypothetical protein ACRDA4_10580 [Filifactoraceae bacterium]